jgi:hypothetical protein
MRTAGLSLYDLVAEAHARCPNLQAIQDWYAKSSVEDVDKAGEVREGWECLEEALSAAAHGDFRTASRAAHFFSRYWAPIQQKYYPHQAYLDWSVCQKHFPAWDAFREVCELAWRIDCFLAALSRDKILAALARDCRHDLSLLLVLADWAEENGLPASAAEARHLHGLVRYRG